MCLETSARTLGPFPRLELEGIAIPLCGVMVTIKQSNTRRVLGTLPNTSSPFTPCCHFTGEQSEVLNASFCLRTHSPELHVAKAHHFHPRGQSGRSGALRKHPLTMSRAQGSSALCARVPAPPGQPGGRCQHAQALPSGRPRPHPATSPTCHPDPSLSVHVWQWAGQWKGSVGKA